MVIFMKKFKVMFLVFAIVAAALAVLAGCQRDDGGDKPAIAGPIQAKLETAPIDAIPIVDYEGKEFNFFVCDVFFTRRDIIAEEITGEAVNDAKYNRFRTIEGKYDIKINLACMGDNTQTYDYLNKSAMTDDIRYDLTHIHASSIVPIVSAGLLMDLKKLSYPDFGNPWWNKNLMEAMTVKNVLLLCPSAIELPYSSAIAFSKQMVQDNAMESPYGLVRKGDWTMDRFYEICSGISKDLDGDGRFGKDDQYGFTTQSSWMLKSYLYAGNHTVLVKDKNDVPQLNKDYGHLANVVDEMMRLFTQGNASYLFDSINENGFPISIDSGRVFAIGLHLAELSYLRSSDIDYGIVPLPKLDKAQENYPGISWGGFFGVPANASDPEMSGVIFEALSGESYYSILPVFKEQQLSLKFARDEESIEMLDLIYDNMIYDMAPNYATLDPYTNILYELYMKKNTDVMSYMEKNEASLRGALDKIVDDYNAYVK